MTKQNEFFRAVADRNIVRVRVAAIVISNGRVLVQRPADERGSCYAFVGGEYELGDTFDSRIRREFEEETTARVVDWHYLFVVENHFTHNGSAVHGLEHYLEVTLDREEVESKEPHLSQHWLPIDRLLEYDVRPHVVRDAIASRSFRHTRHLSAGPQ